MRESVYSGRVRRRRVAEEVFNISWRRCRARRRAILAPSVANTISRYQADTSNEQPETINTHQRNRPAHPPRGHQPLTAPTYWRCAIPLNAIEENTERKLNQTLTSLHISPQFFKIKVNASTVYKFHERPYDWISNISACVNSKETAKFKTKKFCPRQTFTVFIPLPVERLPILLPQIAPQQEFLVSLPQEEKWMLHRAYGCVHLLVFMAEAFVPSHH